MSTAGKDELCVDVRTYIWFMLVDNDASLAVIVVGHCWSMMSLTTAAAAAAAISADQLAVAVVVAPTAFGHSCRVRV